MKFPVLRVKWNAALLQHVRGLFCRFKKTVKFLSHSFDRRRSFCLCNPSLSASHSHHVHPRRSCTSCPSSPQQTSCTSSQSTSAQRASLTKRAGDPQPCGRAPAASGTLVYSCMLINTLSLKFPLSYSAPLTWYRSPSCLFSTIITQGFIPLNLFFLSLSHSPQFFFFC